MVELIKTVGYIGLFGIIFAESGLFVGFFLPGDSLLFTAGVLASQNVLSIFILIPLFFVAAIAGDNVGYAFGRRVGRRFFQREDSFLFHKKNVLRAQAFYEKHGAKTIVLARFIPVVRTFAPIVAGIAEMNYRKFVTYNIVGGVLWAIGVTLVGYFLGSAIGDDIDRFLLPIVALIILVSVAPAILHVLQDPESRAGLRATIARLFNRQSRRESSTIAKPSQQPEVNE